MATWQEEENACLKRSEDFAFVLLWRRIFQQQHLIKCLKVLLIFLLQYPLLAGCSLLV